MPRTDKLILLGDFNARVGRDHRAWAGILGPHGVGNENSNGTLLLTTCAQHELVIINTVFQQADKRNTTWVHPRSGHWHLIDYVIVRKRDRAAVMITRAMRGATMWSDHRLIKSKMKVALKQPKRRQTQTSIRELNVALCKTTLCASD